MILVLSVLGLFVVVGSTVMLSARFVLSGLSICSLYIASVAWCLLPSQWFISNLNSNGHALRRGSFPDESNIVNSHLSAACSIPTVNWLLPRKCIAPVLPIRRQSTYVVSSLVLFPCHSAFRTNIRLICRVHVAVLVA